MLRKEGQMLSIESTVETCKLLQTLQSNLVRVEHMKVNGQM